MTRNTTTGVGYLAIEASGFTLAGFTGATTANTIPTFNRFLTMNGSIGAVFSGAVTGVGVTSTGAVAVNSSSGITTNQTTFPLVNTGATTINFGGAATTINMGTTTGTTGNVFVGSNLGTNVYSLRLRANGQYNLVTSLNSNGGYGTTTYSNISVTGGSGTGMIISMTGIASGYLSAANITNPGTGYVNGDTLTIPAGNPKITMLAKAAHK
jgi:hypothetical protein